MAGIKVLALIAAVGITGCVVEERPARVGGEMVVDREPPAERVEVPPPPPAVEAAAAGPQVAAPERVVWIRGHWYWNGRGWLWVGGHYAPTRPGFRYAHGHWERRGPVWVWVEGSWLRS